MTEDNPFKFDYMLLSRLQQDCEYFLGYGNRSTSRLWAEGVEKQISKMKELWNKVDEKPQWLSWEEILDYEKKMTIGSKETSVVIADKISGTIWGGIFEDDNAEDKLKKVVEQTKNKDYIIMSFDKAQEIANS